ncbi:MAG: hypothetical protein AAGB26_06295 [Planctomycetota bacterium]
MIFIDGPADVRELNAQLAFYGYRLLGRSLVQISSHHPIENPDDLGRPVDGVAFLVRDQVHLYIEFLRVGANVDIRQQALAGSAQIQRFQYRTTPGVEFTVGNTTERAFSESVILGDSDAQALEGRTQFREAGIEFDGLVGLVVPRTRLSGELSVSSFLGSGIERAQVEIPIEIDAPLGRWIEVAQIDSADINAGIAFRTFGWNLDAGGERIIVRVRVDPIVDPIARTAPATQPPPKATRSKRANR